ncbi:hypothetical protein HDV01_007072 [Terramyces sp. JEL0728]|nr:hypothetical protein HDV01_007072 [Terramyces sp. JEL0728]
MSTATVNPVPPATTAAAPPPPVATNNPPVVQPTQAPPQANPTDNTPQTQPTGTDCQTYYATILPRLAGKAVQPSADCCKDSAIKCLQPGIIMTLDLSNQNLTGSIPKDIIFFSKIINLNLTLNHLTGPIPDGIGALTTLNYLTLSYNNLTGSIPDSMGNLNNLYGLDISNNHISGSFPDSMGNLITLQALNVANNSMTGLIPDTMGNMNALQWVILNGNNFSQPVPDSFQALPNFSQFYMGNLAVNGVVPKAPVSRAPLANGWIIFIVIAAGIVVCGIVSYIGTILYKKKKEREALKKPKKDDPKVVEVKKDPKPEVAIVIDAPKVGESSKDLPAIPVETSTIPVNADQNLPRMQVTPPNQTSKGSPYRPGNQNIRVTPNDSVYPENDFVDTPDNYATLGTNYQARAALSFDESRSRKSGSKKSEEVPRFVPDADEIQVVPGKFLKNPVDDVESFTTESVVIPSFLKDMETKSTYSSNSRPEGNPKE